MDYELFSSNKSILQSSAIHPMIATADKSGHFVPVGVTSAFSCCYLLRKNVLFTATITAIKFYLFIKSQKWLHGLLMTFWPLILLLVYLYKKLNWSSKDRLLTVSGLS